MSHQGTISMISACQLGCQVLPAVGGPHLHFEVRNIMPNGGNRWVDPWGGYYPPYGESLWLDGNEETEGSELRKVSNG